MSPATDLPTLPVPNPTRSFWHTTHPNPLVRHRTTADLPTHASVVIIGSGITGVFAARELAASGVTEVVVLEARDICSGATGRNGGHCQSLVYNTPYSSASFQLKNFHSLSDLIQTSQIPCEFFRFPHGGCHAYYSPQAFSEAKDSIKRLRHHSPDLFGQIKVIEDRPQLSALRIPHAVGAVVQSHAASLHPYKLVTWLWAQLLDSSHLNLQTGTPVTSISPSRNTRPHEMWTINTPRGSVVTPNVLLATNGYTAHLLPDEFRSLIVPVQGEMCALTPPASMLEKPLQHDYSFMGKKQDDYLVQRPAEVGGQFMFGGGRMVAARKGVGVSDDSTCDGKAAKYLRTMIPRVMDLELHGDEVVKAQTSVSEGWEYVEVLKDDGNEKKLDVEAEWTGIMGFSRDECPWVGGVPGKEGLWVCAGYTGHGMPNASLSAVHVARLIAAASEGRDWREAESHAVAAESIPASYVITEERMRRARRLPEVEGDFAMPEANF